MFLRICAVERIPLGLAKAKMLCLYLRLLGMICGNGTVMPCPEKVKAIVLLTRPTDVKSLQGFTGSVNWFRRHIDDHAEIQFPLNNPKKLGRGTRACVADVETKIDDVPCFAQL